MWEKITPADIARVKDRLALLRAATLSRHADELKTLDSEQGEIEIFARLVDAFTQKFMNAEAAPSEPAASSEAQSALAVVADSAEPPAPGAEQGASSPSLPIDQPTSPNFGTPPRLRRFIGG